MKTPLMMFSALLLVIPGALASEPPVPMETCEVCHDEVVASFALTQHGKAIADKSAEILEIACTTCHEAGEAHVDDPSTENVKRTPPESACIACHSTKRAEMDLMTPAHVRQSVSCASCHNGGHVETETSAPVEGISSHQEQCVSCHKMQAAMFNLPFAHRNGTTPFDCVECHTVHGNSRQGRTRLIDTGAPCTDCHTAKRLPMIFPHPPNDRHNCVSCHVPHGTTNPRQLTRHNVTLLCLECHADVPSFHDLSRPKYQRCQVCHVAIHGSNRNPALLSE